MITLYNGKLCFTPVRFEDGRVDPDSCAQVARRLAVEFAKQDDQLTIKLGEAVNKVLEEPKYSNVQHISTSALARLALICLDILPDDKNCKDAEKRLKSVLAGQSDKFLLLKAGKRRGVHLKTRYSEGELQLLKNEK